MNNPDIHPLILDIKDDIVKNRRWFHQNPELSFDEVNTSAKIVELLRSYGVMEIFEKIGRTGVVAIIRGKSTSSTTQNLCIALRADMDALPVQESGDIAFKSRNNGIMHACGHDGHMAELLGVARVLQSNRSSFAGSVKLIFQPAEEGFGGAKEMINDGVLEDNFGPRVDAIYGIHLWSFSATGNVCVSQGPVMAASDKFEIHVRGKGGHGAAPQGTVDAIVEAASLVTSLQTIVSRNKDPLESGVITCGTINGGFGYNIIADSVTISGTTRSFTPQTQELIHSRMCEVCRGTAAVFGGEIDIDYTYGYPPTVNSYPECVEVVRRAATKVVGAVNASLPMKTMGAEDFSYFLQERPGCFFFVGAALPGPTRPHHKSVFDFDEDAMLIAASIFLHIVEEVMGASSAK